MKRTEIGLRDPYVLLDNGKYYLYGTRNETTWGDADGFDVYVGKDLENWDEKKEIFHNDGSFWATQNYWAPECVKYQDAFYLITTFGSRTRKKGVQILRSERPDGPFLPISEFPVTPEEWNCLDGTLYLDDEQKPWLIFSHSIPEELRGAICAMRLSYDLTRVESEPMPLFCASTVSWTRPIPFAKEEFGVEEDAYFSDGPYLFRNQEQELCMLWSSWGEHGYAMGISVSVSGKLEGPWKHGSYPIVQGGGHGMVFLSKEQKPTLAYHSPNDTLQEHPVFVEL